MDLFNVQDIKHRINNIDNIRLFLNIEDSLSIPRSKEFISEMTFLLVLENLEYYYLLLELFSSSSNIRLKQERYNELPYPNYEVNIISNDNKLFSIVFIGLDHVLDYLKNVDKYSVIVDKNRLMRKIKKTSNKPESFVMTPKEFEDLSVSFFVNTIRVAKAISEDELIVSNYLYDKVKNQILDLTRLYIEIKSEGKKSVGANGEGISYNLEADLYDIYLKVFKTGSNESFWDSLFSAASLFRKLGLAISATKSSYIYPKREDVESMNYLRFLYKKFGRE